MPLLFPQPSLSAGWKGPAVMFWQRLLIILGFNPEIVPDGNYAEQTTIGTKAFQSQAGIEQTGDLDEETRKLFFQMYRTDLNTIDQKDFEGETTAPATDQVV